MKGQPRRLKLGRAHLIIVGIGWLLAASMTVKACLNYNQIAGTDKTPQHIAFVAAITPVGPLTGHFINSSAGGFQNGLQWFLILSPILVLAISPFLFLRREVGLVTQIAAWTGFVVGVGFWFFTSVISVGMYLM